MFKVTTFLLVWFLIPIKFSLADSAADMRQAFYDSVLKSDKIPDFLKKMERILDPTPLEEAYIGASKALEAREAWNPIEKLFLIQNCRKRLNNAIIRDGSNIEIRFLRFSIEQNIPEFFRSGKSVEEDKLIILKELSTVSRFQIEESFVNYILQFFEDTQSCSTEELEIIKSRLI